MHPKPIVVLDPWDDYALLRAQVDHWVRTGFVSRSAAHEVAWTSTVDEALDVIAAGWAAAG